MKIEVPLDKLTLLSIFLIFLNLSSVQGIYKFTKYRGFIPTLSEAALTDVGGKIYSFLTPLSGMISFSIVVVTAAMLLPDTKVAKLHLKMIKMLSLFSYLCLSYQAIVPFNKERRLDTHTVMAGLFMLGVLFTTSFYTYVAWTEFEIEDERRYKCLVIRLLDSLIMGFCVISVIPFMFGVLRSKKYKESKIILKNNIKLLNRMGLLQLIGALTLPIFLISIYWESNNLYVTIRKN